MIKQLIRSRIGNALVGWTAGIIIAILMRTVRWRAHKNQNITDILRAQNGVVLVFWHERLIAMPWLWPSALSLSALQSPHPDGRMMSYAIGCFGIKTVWGSSNRSPLSGLRGLKRVLDNGDSVAITPDGPRGPARIMAAGPVSIAQMAGKAIVPMCWSVDRYWRATGWDRLIIPKPFANGEFIMGAPITVEKLDKAALEDTRMAIETAMNKQADMIDIAVGGRTIA
jgi:lysophospholipid acyltransferase (LPLAT)-like uncharacterized protein